MATPNLAANPWPGVRRRRPRRCCVLNTEGCGEPAAMMVALVETAMLMRVGADAADAEVMLLMAPIVGGYCTASGWRE